MKTAKHTTTTNVVATMLGAATVVLVVMVALSLRWRMQHDSPIMLYIAYLIDHFNCVPYKEIFDMNMPGTYYVYRFFGRILSAYTDLGFRITDVLYLAAILTVTWFWLKRLGRMVAWCGAVLFGLWYLGEGPRTSLQREFLVLLPIIAAAYLSTSFSDMRPAIKGFLIGVLFGLAATVKPFSVIGLPLVAAYQLIEIRRRPSGRVGDSLRFLALTILGFALPVLVVLVHLWRIGALTSFLDIARNYWPLYAEISRLHEVLTGKERIAYLFKTYFTFGEQQWWLVAAATGVVTSFLFGRLNAGQRRHVVLLALLAVFYSVYALLSGKFWRYHWILFFYFVVQLGSLCLVGLSAKVAKAKQILPVLVLVVIVAVSARMPREINHQIRGMAAPAPLRGRIDQIASYLEKNMRPGDRVQPLDWTGGAIHAMLITKARIATPFVYDFHFYHHVSNPYIQGLRDRFIESLERSHPRFIIEIISRKPWVKGWDTSREFVELRRILDIEYSRVLVGNGYTVYEKRPRLQ